MAKVPINGISERSSTSRTLPVLRQIGTCQGKRRKLRYNTRITHDLRVFGRLSKCKPGSTNISRLVHLLRFVVHVFRSFSRRKLVERMEVVGSTIRLESQFQRRVVASPKWTDALAMWIQRLFDCRSQLRRSLPSNILVFFHSSIHPSSSHGAKSLLQENISFLEREYISNLEKNRQSRCGSETG
jgi:hypothetical protein